MSIRGALATVVALGSALIALVAGLDARADAPESPAGFSAPLVVDNVLFPVEPGTIQVFLGRDEGKRVTVVVSHLADTRDFELGDAIIRCRAVSEHTFQAGALLGEEVRWYAQDDDGSVWVFGETEEDDADDDDDDDDDEPGGWVVGAVMPTDPVDTVSVDRPSLMMPAAPSTGDVWLVENAGAGQTQIFEARSTDANVRVRRARFRGALRVRETAPGGRGATSKWFAPGVGMIRERGDGTRLRLNASTLRGGRR